MSNPVHGSGVLIELLVVDTYYPVLCGTDCSINYNPEFVLKTGPDSPARERMPRIEDWDISVSGLTKIANDAALTFFYMIQQAVRRSLLSLRAKFTDDEGTIKTMDFQAYVGPSSISGPMSDFSQCSINFSVTGGLTDLSDPEDDPTPVSKDIFSDWWTTTNGNNYIDGGSSGEGNDGHVVYTLVDTDIVKQVVMSGIQYDIVPGTPVAGSRTCQLDLTNHKINFPFTLRKLKNRVWWNFNDEPGIKNSDIKYHTSRIGLGR